MRFLVWLSLFAGFGLMGMGEDVAAEKPAEANTVHLEYALYFAPKEKSDPKAALEKILKERYPRMTIENGSADKIIVFSSWVPLKTYAPPSEESFKYFTRGLAFEERLKLMKAERVFIINFALPRKLIFEGNKDASMIIGELAELCDGNPWDEECRLLYSAKKWKELRAEGWEGQVPNIMNHITIHFYSDGELMRMITLGMRKFGLADIVVNQLTKDDSKSIGLLINLCCQLAAEGTSLKEEGTNIAIAAVKHPEMKKFFEAGLKNKATGQATILFKKTKREEGDPENALLEMDFKDSKDKKDLNEKQNELIEKIFGVNDSIVNIESGNKRLKKASASARGKAIKELKPRIIRGLAPGENLLMKFPFATPEKGRNEFMWVEIISWKEDTITGILQNTPFLIPDLKCGARVTVKEKDIYDYIWRKEDGSVEGNETGRMIEELSKESNK